MHYIALIKRFLLTDLSFTSTSVKSIFQEENSVPKDLKVFRLFERSKNTDCDSVELLRRFEAVENS